MLTDVNHAYTTIKKLFEEWRNNPQYNIHAFIEDGIVDPEKYDAPHILFALRDMNRSTPCDLCHELKTTGSGWKTWNNVGRWANALLDGNPDYPYAIDRIEFLRRVSVMNIKKECSGSRAHKSELIYSAQMQHKDILQEIRLCDPKIIICCGFGNAGILKESVFKELSSDWQNDLASLSFKRNWFYYYATINNQQIPVIDFCHPQVTHLEGKHGRKDLFAPLYQDMLHIKQIFDI